MEVKACKNCRRLFNYMYGPEICPECLKSMPEKKDGTKKDLMTATLNLNGDDDNGLKYEQVRDYIMTNPKATVAQIADVNDVTPSKIFEWIRDDRLEFSDDSEYAWFTCAKCGIKIRSGRLCSRCKSKERN
jgi:RNA polymerase subunit RPABC4/transcription elongation factor Spt4